MAIRGYTKGVNAARIAENLTWQSVGVILDALPAADIAGMIAWAGEDAQDGVQLPALIAAWPALAALTEPQQRFVMRFVVRAAGGVVVG